MNQGKDLYYVCSSLDGPEIREVDENLFTLRSIPLAQRTIRKFFIFITINEIINYINPVLYLKLLQGFIFQII